MSSRTALENGTELCFTNSAGGEVRYTVVREIRRGASCIIYDASYLTNAGDRKTVRIKECYPFRLRIQRSASGFLTADPEDEQDFADARRRFINDFTTVNSLVRKKSLYDEVTTTIDIHHANGTVYLVSTFTSDLTLDRYRPTDIQECISIVRQAAVSIGSLHEAGYLYLDVKPENILLIEGNLEYPRAQLFDFDSLIPYRYGEIVLLRHRYKLSFSKGYAAIELQTGQIRKIGRHTDVYGIASLLFCLLFGRTPDACDCEEGSAYAFEKMEYPVSDYSDRLLNALHVFFHHGLANYYRDRYRDMNELVHALDELRRLADRQLPYACFAKLTVPAEILGRKKELEFLQHWYEDSSSRCLFVTGMGGIGKSTLVRWFLCQQMKGIVSTVYLSWKGTIAETVTDDTDAKINAVSRLDQETTEEYFHRKLEIYKNILAGTETVLVIDDFELQDEQEIRLLVDVGWKVILICRNVPAIRTVPVCQIREFADFQDYIGLFSSVLGRTISEEENEDLRRIVTLVHGHTLALELIAKHILSSSVSMRQEAEQIESHGFSSDDDPVAWEKDDHIRIAAIRSIITALFDGSALSGQAKALLQLLSLSGDPGIAESVLSSVLGHSLADELGILAREGWIIRAGGLVSVHPVIRETAQAWQWQDESMKYYRTYVSFLCTALKMEERKEDYPVRMLKVNRLISRVMKFSPVSRQFFEAHTAASGIYGEAVRKRVEEAEQPVKKDPAVFRMHLLLGEQAVSASRRIVCLKEDGLYYELLYRTVLSMPRYREEYILRGAEELLRAEGRGTPTAIMKTHSKMMGILEERGEYGKALHALRTLKDFVRKNGNRYHTALYYSMTAEYFDYLAEGDYEGLDPHHEAVLKAFLYSLDQSVRNAMKSRHPDAARLAADGKLAIATVLLRNGPSQTKKIRNLLSEAYQMVNAYCQPFSETSFVCQMTFAWYYTLAEPDLYMTAKALSQAMKIEQVRDREDLDLIDEYLVPAADIYRNHERYDEAEHFIRIALAMCEKHEDAAPYRRKIEMLQGCLRDLHEEAQSEGELEEYCSTVEEKYEHHAEFMAELKQFIRIL